MVGPVQKDNSYVNQLKKLIDEKKINKNVTWTGTLINDYKNLVYNISYVFCFPTHSENFGITIAESLSNKLPVITTNKTNIYKILKKNKIGFITNDNTRNIKKNLEMFLNLSKREYDRYKLNSYKCFQENFNLETNVEKFVSTLKNSIEKFRKKKIG
jgi:glycosyltransferase involved in cell wall biosynthesis